MLVLSWALKKPHQAASICSSFAPVVASANIGLMNGQPRQAVGSENSILSWHPVGLRAMKPVGHQIIIKPKVLIDSTRLSTLGIETFHYSHACQSTALFNNYDIVLLRGTCTWKTVSFAYEDALSIFSSTVCLRNKPMSRYTGTCRSRLNNSSFSSPQFFSVDSQAIIRGADDKSWEAKTWSLDYTRSDRPHLTGLHVTLNLENMISVL